MLTRNVRRLGTREGGVGGNIGLEEGVVCAYHMRGISGIKDTSGIGIWIIRSLLLAQLRSFQVRGAEEGGERRTRC